MTNPCFIQLECWDLFWTCVVDGSACLLTDLCKSRYALYPVFWTSLRFGKVGQTKKFECKDFFRILWKNFSLKAGFIISACRFVNLCHAEYFSWRSSWDPDTCNFLLSKSLINFTRNILNLSTFLILTHLQTILKCLLKPTEEEIQNMKTHINILATLL